MNNRKTEDNISVKIILGCIDQNCYSCIFNINKKDLISFFVGIISILEEPTMIGMDIMDVETLMNRTSSGTYVFNRYDINDTVEKIVHDIIIKFDNKKQFYNFNRYLLTIRGDVSLIKVNDIANLIYDLELRNNEIDIVFNSIYDEETDGIELYLYGIQSMDE